MKSKQTKSIFLAILAASMYAISSPISKILLDDVPPTLMAALLYLGAGIGMAIVGLIRKKISKETKESHLTRKELPYAIGMIILDIAAPIFLMIGLSMTTSANAALLNNFEIVATSIIALIIFKETISKRLWTAIILITISVTVLSLEDISSFSFSFGSIFVLLACISWGFENNCTRMMSSKDPLEIVVLKGFGSGLGSLIISFILKEGTDNIKYIILALVLGFLTYGLSVFFYVYAQRELGAAKTSTYYAVSPFIGAFLSLLIFKEIPTGTFIIALVIMIIGTYFASTEKSIKGDSPRPLKKY